MWRAGVVVLGVALVVGCGGSGPVAVTQLAIDRQTGTAATVLRPSQATLRCDQTALATGFLRNTAGPACALVHLENGAALTARSIQHIVAKLAAAAGVNRRAFTRFAIPSLLTWCGKGRTCASFRKRLATHLCRPRLATCR